MKFLSTFILLVFIVAGIDSCQQGKEASVNSDNTRMAVQFVIDPECYSAISELDFGDRMPEIISSSRTIRETDDIWAMDTSRLRVSVDDPELTATEIEMINGVHYLSRFGGRDNLDENGNPRPDSDTPEYVRVSPYTATPFFEVKDYQTMTGTDPSDGIELFMFWTHVQAVNPSWPDLSTKDGLAEFLAWDESKQLDYAMRYINPVTGKVFGDFSNTEWQPGAFVARQATEGEIQDKAASEVAILQNHNEAIPGATIMTLYGERQDVVLAEQVVLHLPENSVLLNLRDYYPSGEVVLD